jgi:hypothetical protein
MPRNLLLITRWDCQLLPLCRIFAVLAEIFAGFVAEIIAEEVKIWLALKRLQKKQVSLLPLFLARCVDFIMSINKLAKKLLLLQKRLNYPLNAERQTSTGGRTNSVGVVAPYISRWYFSQVISGAEQALREAGMDLLLYNFSQMKGRERLFQHQLLKGRVDALIVISLPPTEEEFDSMLSLGIPIALSWHGS